MTDAREEAWLAQKLAEVEPLPMRNLDRHFLLYTAILREVNATESAAPERRHDFVLPEGLASKEQNNYDGVYTHDRHAAAVSCDQSRSREWSRDAHRRRSASPDARAAAGSGRSCGTLRRARSRIRGECRSRQWWNGG